MKSIQISSTLSIKEAGFDEAWLQDLIFRHPQLLPVSLFDDSLSQPVPLAREVATNAGSIDNLYITPEGRLILVETKLWKNPEQHRTVVAQTIEISLLRNQ